VVESQDLEAALEKSFLGILKQVDTRDTATIRRVAIHEVGHAFLAAHYSRFFALSKVSIQASYSGSGGFTLFQEHPHLREGGLYTRELLKARLVVALGGRAAEFVFFGGHEDQVSTGATQDLKQANELARQMVTKYGMGVGPTAAAFYGEDAGTPTAALMSEAAKRRVDAAVSQLVSEAYKRAKTLLELSRETVAELAEQLQEHRVLSGGDFSAAAAAADTST
jgi:cell division protease FtsH